MKVSQVLIFIPRKGGGGRKREEEERERERERENYNTNRITRKVKLYTDKH